MMTFALVIDDCKEVADNFCRMLTLLKIESKAVYSPRAAMKSLEDQVPSLVFLDINMPGVDGFEVLSYLKREPRLEGIPVFVVSSENQPDIVKRAYEKGAEAYILKPVSLDELEVALKEFR